MHSPAASAHPPVTLLAVFLLTLCLGVPTVAPVAGQETAANATVVELSLDATGGSVTAEQRRQVGATIKRRLSGTGYEGTIEPREDGLRLRLRPAAPRPVVARLVQPGAVSILASTPGGTTAEVVSNADIEDVGSVRVQNGTGIIPLQLTPEGAGEFSGALRRLNLTANPLSCDTANRSGHCLTTRLDGDPVSTANLTPPFAESIASGRFNQSRGFGVTAPNRTRAETLRVAMATDPLPVGVDAISVRNVSGESATGTATRTATPTPTATVTVTATATPTPTPSPATTPANGTTGASGPGFTPGGTLAALVALVCLAAAAVQTLRS